MKISLRHAFLVSAALSAVLLAGCTSSIPVQLPPANSQTLRIVSSMPSKGQAAHQSKLIREAIDLAIAEHQATHSQPAVEHIPLDDGDPETGDWSRAKEEANALAAATAPGVIAYIGPYNSGAAMVSIPILSQAGVLQLLPSATWPGLTQPGWASGEPERYYPGKRNVLRLTPPDSVEATLAAQRMHDLGAARVLAVGDDSDYSRGMTAAFKSAAQKLGLAVGAPVAVGDAPRYSGDVDAIFAAPSNLGEATRLAEGLQGKSLRLGVYVTDVAMSDELTPEARQQMKLEGWHFLLNADASFSNSPSFRQFAATFQQKYDEQPSEFAANAYDATQLALNLLPAQRRVASALQLVNQAGQLPVGVAGPLNFDERGDIIGRDASVYILASDGFTLEWPSR